MLLPRIGSCLVAGNERFTLGLIVKMADKPGRTFALTCAHGLRNLSRGGDVYWSPNQNGSNRQLLGTFFQDQLDSYSDFGLIEINEDVKLDKMPSIPVLPDKWRDPYSEDATKRTAVHIVSANHPGGIIEYIWQTGIPVEGNGPAGTLKKCTSILSKTGVTRIDKGDSGSVAIDKDGYVLGMVVRRSAYTDTYQAGYILPLDNFQFDQKLTFP